MVVMPAYNAAATLKRTWDEVMATGVVDRVIVVDDASRDDTVAIASSLPDTTVHVHAANLGYGANQKTCYRLALEAGADVVIMVHPDYQYTPLLIPAMASLIADGPFRCVMGSRILGGRALAGGMPRWRYAGNRALTLVQNWLTGAKLSEFHSGYRAFAADLLRSLPLETNSNDFVFDSQVLAEILWRGCVIAEISCPTRYAADASSIGFLRSVSYGTGCLLTALEYRLTAMHLVKSRRFALSTRNCDREAREG